MKALRLVSILLWFHLYDVQSANILGVFIIPSYSHQVVFQALWKELSLRGHQVTVLTPYPVNDPTLVNLTEIDLGFSREIWDNANLQMSIHKDLSYYQLIHNTFTLTGNVVEAQLLHPTVQKFVHNESHKFDVMLVEFLQPLMYSLSIKFNCPMIGITSFGALVVGHDAVGNPSHPALNPDLLFSSTENLGFFNRFYSTYFSMLLRYYYYYHVVPKYDAFARKYVAKDIPYLGDIEKNVSLLFLNVNPLFHTIRPNVPAVIELGGMHLNKQEYLSADLQKEMDNANEGIVYFNLGSNIRSVALHLVIRQKLLQALSELPYKVLWKWEDDYLPEQPKNVIIRKWFPQKSILGHPNIKVFLTQGGLQSIEEATTNRVPLVVMPFFVDQPFNAMRMVNLGVARCLDIKKVTKNEIKEALIEVAENPMYRINMKKVFDLLFDVPMTGLEKAIWWTEYVIRHKDVRHLRSPAIDLPWYQYLLLDVLIFLLATMVILTCILYVCILLGVRVIRGKIFKSKLKMA